MREVCRDVKVEPGLLPVENPAILKPGTNITKGARLDISGMGVKKYSYSAERSKRKEKWVRDEGLIEC